LPVAVSWSIAPYSSVRFDSEYFARIAKDGNASPATYPLPQR
jgi:hypothetical protein